MSHPSLRNGLGALVSLALLTGCPTVDLGAPPVSPGACRPAPAYFADVLWPELLASDDVAVSCVGQPACHRIEDGRSALRLSTDPVDLDRNYDIATRFLDCGSPENSALLTKPLSGIDPHGGDDLFAPGSPEEALFLDWFIP